MLRLAGDLVETGSASQSRTGRAPGPLTALAQFRLSSCGQRKIRAVAAHAEHDWPAIGVGPDQDDDKLLFVLSFGASLVASIGLLIYLLIR